MAQISDLPMTGRSVLITGGTSGIGKSTALGLSKLGANVAITGRSRSRGNDAAREILAAGGGRVEVFVADMSSQSQVRALADQVLDTLPRIDVLVNNVGGYWNSRHVTADGLEHTFALNHLGPFLLTDLLLPHLMDSSQARVVNVASKAEALGRIDFDDLQGEHSYSGARAYSQSKLANLLFTYELAKRLRGTRVTVNAVHPGMVSTSLGAEDPALVQRLLVPFLRPFMRSPAKGATTSVHVASDPQLEQTSGLYFVKSAPKRSSARSYNNLDATRLWKTSRELVELTT